MKKMLFAAFLFLVMIFGASPMSAQCGYWTGPCPNPNPWGVPPPPTPHIECGRMPDGRIVCFCDGCNSVMQSPELSPLLEQSLPLLPKLMDDPPNDPSDLVPGGTGGGGPGYKFGFGLLKPVVSDSPFFPPDPSCTDQQDSDRSGQGCH